MAWIPLLLASWIILDVLIVAIVLVIARQRRQPAAPKATPTPDSRSAGASMSRRRVPARSRSGAMQ